MESNLVALQAVGELAPCLDCRLQAYAPAYLPYETFAMTPLKLRACEPSCLYSVLVYNLFAAASLRTMLGPGRRYARARPRRLRPRPPSPPLPSPPLPSRSIKCYVSDLPEENALLSDPLQVLDAVTARISVSAAPDVAVHARAAACSPL